MNRDILVKLDSNYADEFDVHSFWVTTEDDYKKFVELIAKYDFTDADEIYFGTNEWISFGSTDELLNSLSYEIISDHFARDLIRYIGESYGLINIEYLAEYAYKRIMD